MKKEYEEEDYRIIFGVEKPTYDKMVEIATYEYEILHKKGAEMTDLLHKNV